MKRDKLKNALIEQLKEMPIAQLACKKACVGRSSYYRWRKDPEFAKAADAAITEGEALITDMSESQLIGLIRDKNFSAIQLWLRTHHPKYTNKMEINANLQTVSENLTPEQEAIVKKALRLASLSEPIKKLSEEKCEKSKHQQNLK